MAETGEQVEQGCFARAVFAEQRVDFARHQGQIDRVVGLNRAEPFADPMGGHNRCDRWRGVHRMEHSDGLWVLLFAVEIGCFAIVFPGVRIMGIEDLTADLVSDVFDFDHRCEELGRIGMETGQDLVFKTVAVVGDVDRKDHWGLRRLGGSPRQ